MPGTHKIFHDFRRGVPAEALYAQYDIDEATLADILQRNIKGNYDYKKILAGGKAGQAQFLRHLNARWNPLDPGAKPDPVTPYVPTKTPVDPAEDKESR